MIGNMRVPALLVIVSLARTCSVSAGTPRPNILVFLTDDLDLELGGMTPLSKTRKWIGDHGVWFNNSFVTTPICCPSRASTLTGLYQHNTKVINNAISGNCGSAQWRQGPERRTYATELKSHGYVTMYSGKYLNQYGTKQGGGVEHVPPGWDFWSGLVGNSRYYNYTLSINGKSEVHGDNYEEDYLTDVIGKRAHSFIELYNARNASSPFLMVLATPSPHAPFTPAPQYGANYSELHAPRTPAFNHLSSQDHPKHWLIQSQPQEMGPDVIEFVDECFRNRWRTLLSVDDLVDDVLSQLDRLEILENTFVVFTSDHGFHLGQFGMPWDKRQLYETDLRVPLLIRGPGIKPNTFESNVVTNLDLAPTLIEVGTGHNPDYMDGSSFLSHISYELTNQIPLDGEPQERTFLVEYHGEGGGHGIDAPCKSITDHNVTQCRIQMGCKCQDSLNNTYSCLRTYSSREDSIFCQFADDVAFVEMYDIREDPFELYNLGAQMNTSVRRANEDMLKKLQLCRGRVNCMLLSP